MPKLPVISGRKLIMAFKRLHYEVDHQTGSHFVLRSNVPPYRRIVIPNHKCVAKGTLRAIMREAGITLEELLNLI